MSVGDLPRWQLESVYPTDDATAFEADRERVRQALDELERYLDEHEVHGPAAARGGGAPAGGAGAGGAGAGGATAAASTGGGAPTAGAAAAGTGPGGGAAGPGPGGAAAAPQAEAAANDRAASVLAGLLERLERVYVPFVTLRAYLHNRLAVDADDAEARARSGELDPTGARLEALQARLTAWIGTLELEALLGRAPLLEAHAHLLRRAKQGAAHLMGEEAEELAAALDPSSGNGWEQLHGDLISLDTIELALEPGEAPRRYGVAQLRILQGDAREPVRAAALQAELALLRRNRIAYAASMNGIKGQVSELARRRGWPSPLDTSLFESGIDRASLEAMQTACVERFPDLRRYLAAKARALGKERLAWHDLLAPLPGEGDRRFGWEEAKDFVLQRFAAYSPRLEAFAARVFREGWVDAEPRPGKRNGAFCSPLFGPRESRVMLNFGGRLDDVFTIAHEFGHAYHNDCMFRFGRSLLQSDSPMTLAETASIFCETLVLDAMLAEADDAAQLAILEQDLQSTTGLVLDIHSRFLFESAVFAARASRPLAADELDALMLDAQARAYGEDAGADLRHPLMWAQKPHYYNSGTSFYNYPYTFGYLFGLGLFAVYQADKAAFVDRYDALLAGTGMAAPAELAAGFGIDIHDPAFWRAGLAVCGRRVDQFEALVERMHP